MYSDIKEYVSFDNGKYSYVSEGGLVNVYRGREFQRLASKPEINIFHKVLELEKSSIVEYDCDGVRVK